MHLEGYSCFLSFIVGRFGEWELSKGMGKVITYGRRYSSRGTLQFNRDRKERYKFDTRTDWTDATTNEIVVGLKSGKGGCLFFLFLSFLFFVFFSFSSTSIPVVLTISSFFTFSYH